MKRCLICDGSVTNQPGVEPKTLRIKQGGADYRKFGAQFVCEEEFEDGDRLKWLCFRCATGKAIFTKLLDFDLCILCNNTFEPADSLQSDCVLLVETGEMKSLDKRPGKGFVPSSGGMVHFVCACDDWGLPLWALDRKDTA